MDAVTVRKSGTGAAFPVSTSQARLLAFLPDFYLTATLPSSYHANNDELRKRRGKVLSETNLSPFGFPYLYLKAPARPRRTAVDSGGTAASAGDAARDLSRGRDDEIFCHASKNQGGPSKTYLGPGDVFHERIINYGPALSASEHQISLANTRLPTKCPIPLLNVMAYQ